MELIDDETEQAAEAPDQEGDLKLEDQQPPEPPKSLAEAKEDLAAALKKFKARSVDLESSAKRLAEAQKEEQDLLEASMHEEEQVEA
jgi:hypothetical protein